MKKLFFSIISIISIICVFLLIAGDYVYREGTKLPCSTKNLFSQKNQPNIFFPNDEDNGPFKGDGWKKWVNKDLSEWWVEDNIFEKITFENPDGTIKYSAWWIAPTINKNKDAVIIVHGYGASKNDFTVLMPAGMLAKRGFNVLVLDSRNAGESTCISGRHSAGQNEVLDILYATEWLKNQYNIPINKIGIHGVSGGAIAAMYSLVKSDQIAAISLHGIIFDFNKIARHEVRYQGFPEFLWSAALIAAKLRGVDLKKIEPYQGIDNLKGRPLQVFHEYKDSRLPIWNMTDLISYMDNSNKKADFYIINDADHMEGLLLKPYFFENKLTDFFQKALRE